MNPYAACMGFASCGIFHCLKYVFFYNSYCNRNGEEHDMANKQQRKTLGELEVELGDQLRKKWKELGKKQK